MDATYEWDTEGKMIGSLPPSGGLGGGAAMKYLYFHDAMGRLGSMVESTCLAQTVTTFPCGSLNGNGIGATTVATAVGRRER